MKLFSTLLCATILLASPSYATGIFIGADALFATSSHRAISPSTISGPKDGDYKDADKLNYGLNAGVRLDLANLYASGEVFYDNLKTSSKNFESFDGSLSVGDRIKINNRYGVKANLGLAIFPIPKITPFITYGLAGVNYASNVLSDNASVTKSKLTPIYGAGLLIDLPLGISAKASYDYQQFNMQYAESGSKIRTHLGVAKLGLIYNF